MSSISPHTAEEWARDFLAQAGFVITPDNLRAVVSWEYAESGVPPNAAKFNPLNTTQKMPGSWDFNYNGGYPVQNYPDYRTGIVANAKVIHNGYYPNVVAALTAGNDAQAVVDAVVASPWGTHHIRLIGSAPVPPAPPPPRPAPEVLLTTVAHPNGGWIRPVPFYGALVCEGGARLKGDKPNGANHVWTSDDPQVKASGSKLVDAFARLDGGGVEALYDLGGGDVRGYQVPFA